MSKEFVFKISEPGVSVHTASAKDLYHTMQYDTFKIKITGTLTESLPEETVTAGNSKQYTENYAHGLTGVPMYWPEIHSCYNAGYGTTDDFVINDNGYFLPPGGAYSPPTNGEWFDVTIDSTNLVLTTTRTASISDEDYGAHDAIYYYTIFYNRVDEELDLS